MNISVFQCYLTLFLTIIFGLCPSATIEQKDAITYKLCGEDFVTAYKSLCGQIKTRGRRSVWKIAKRETPKLKAAALPVLQEKLAKQFLRRIRRLPRSLSNNAVEECCIETCTLEEVREYPCN